MLLCIRQDMYPGCPRYSLSKAGDCMRIYASKSHPQHKLYELRQPLSAGTKVKTVQEDNSRCPCKPMCTSSPGTDQGKNSLHRQSRVKIMPIQRRIRGYWRGFTSAVCFCSAAQCATRAAAAEAARLGGALIAALAAADRSCSCVAAFEPLKTPSPCSLTACREGGAGRFSAGSVVTRIDNITSREAAYASLPSYCCNLLIM